MKHILYNSSTGAYFATFVPCWFAPAALHFDLAWVVRHGVLVWVGAFVLSTVRANVVRQTEKDTTILNHLLSLF